MTKNEMESIYDYPVYYDLVFGSDWKAERDFLRDCFRQHINGATKRLFEPACGTGRLLFRLAKDGYQVSGLDLNSLAVEYCNKRLAKHGFAETAFVADMTDFRIPKKADAAFNTINSFRHLATERLAQDHLTCMGRAIRKGGVYILGLHLSPIHGDVTEDEGWSAQRGLLCVNTYMWLSKREPKKRMEHYRMSYDVHTPSKHMRIVNDVSFRTYTRRQFESLVRSVPAWKIEATYDFSYEIDNPIEVTEHTEDVVYVLKRV